jgi:DNA-binding CsgD family transcriptional regulator/tetratricopeptide (TPR) repeat protein
MRSTLVERDQVLAQMHLAMAQARTPGQGGLSLLIPGEAGIGKTTLLDHFVRSPQGECRVLWGACEDLFTPRPLGPLMDLMPNLGADVVGALRAGNDQAAIFSAFLADLCESPRPSLLIFEDVHWADHATLDLIKFLGRRISRVRALLVLTYRHRELTPGHPLLKVLGELPAAHVQRLQLLPLSRQAVQDLARQRGYHHTGVFEKTNGNPFFVTEVLACPEHAVPPTVQDAVLVRLQRQSVLAIELCERVSAIPGGVNLAFLSQWQSRTDQSVDLALDECVRAGILEIHGQAVRFRHELARLAVHEMLAPLRKRALHAEILKVLQTSPGVTPARLVFHAVQADQADAILRFATAAGVEAARVGAHREAATHYALALAHAELASPQTRAELNEVWSYEAGLAMTVNQDVLNARKRAVSLWRDLGDTKRVGLNLRWLSRLHWYLGERDQSLDYGAQAIDALESIPPCDELAMAYSVRSQVHMLNSNYESAMVWGEKALQLARTLDATEARIHALNNLGTSLLMSGRPGGETLLEESLALAKAGAFHEQAARAYTNLSSTMILQCRFAEAERFCADGVAYDREHDLDSWTYYLLGLYAQLAAERGEFSLAQALATEALAVPSQTPVMRWPPSLALGLTKSRTGAEDAIKTLEDCLAIALKVGEAQLIMPTCRALAEAHWLRGELNQACLVVSQGLTHRVQADDPWLTGQLTVWAFRLGMPVENSGPVAAIYQLEMDGQAQAAALQWEALGAPFEQAVCLMRCGEPGLRQAAELFTKQGSHQGLDMVRNQARKEGVKGIKRGKYAAARDNQLGLTAREHQIYTLLAAGLSNSEISGKLNRSVRTVEHHASQVLAKVGVKSRAEIRTNSGPSPFTSD